MDTELLKGTGALLSFMVVFLFSIFHKTLAITSRIAINRFLEDKDKKYRTKILDQYEDLKLAVEIFRIILFLAFLVYVVLVFPRLLLWPFWLFLIFLGIYILFLDWLPQIIGVLTKKQVLSAFLPSSTLILALSRPFTLLSRFKGSEKDVDEQHETSEEEIDALIEEAKEEGIIEKEEGILLKSVVEFGDTIVREIMTPRVSMVCIRKDADIQRLRELVHREKHSRIPVYRDRVDNIEGIIVAKDLLEYSEDRHKESPIEPLIREAYFVPESMRVAELLKELQNRKQKMAVVVDEHGGVSGLVTMEDLMEEIVGEIQDEYDKDIPPFIEQGPYDFIVRGNAEVDELDRIFGTALDEEDYITVGGLITHHLGHLPKTGERLTLQNLSIEILEVDQKKVKKIRIKKETKTG